MRPDSLRNTYYALRHGTSTANVEGIVVSHPDNGLFGYGLSAAGRDELPIVWQHHAGKFAKNDTLILSSDFLRAWETAELFSKFEGLAPARKEPRLRERFFGAGELGGNNFYEQVWQLDAEDANHTEFGCESVSAVLARALSMIEECEQKEAGKNIILVAHGDVLQILQTWFAGVEPSGHRGLPHLENGELRQLN